MHCQKNKFIFIHLPKCAGTFFKHFYLSNNKSDYTNNTDLKIYQDEHDVFGEHNLQTIVNKFNLNHKDYYKFTIVRNPWDRAVSMYTFLGGWKYNYIQKSGKEQHLLPQIYPFHEFYKNDDFDGFVNYCYNDKALLKFHKGYYDNFVDRLTINNEISIDKFYKQEDINSLITDLPVKLNFTNKNVFTDWRKNSSSDFQKFNHYSEYYSDSSKNLIKSHFERDINYFDYSFQSSLKL